MVTGACERCSTHQHAQLAQTPGPLADLGAGAEDMADTAARMEHLDLFITVDTSVAHLAGGLGIPTWVLTKNTADWSCLGQNYNPAPAEGMRMMIGYMLKYWLSEKEIELMIKTNPAKLLGLD